MVQVIDEEKIKRERKLDNGCEMNWERRPERTMLNEEEKCIRDKLIEMKMLKVVTEPYEDLPLDIWIEEISTHRFIDEPIFVYYNYNPKRKQVWKVKRWLIGEWHFKTLVDQNPLRITDLEKLEEFPHLLKYWCWGDGIQLRIRAVDREYRLAKCNPNSSLNRTLIKCMGCGANIDRDFARILEGKKKIILCDDCADNL